MITVKKNSETTALKFANNIVSMLAREKKKLFGILLSDEMKKSKGNKNAFNTFCWKIPHSLWGFLLK